MPRHVVGSVRSARVLSLSVRLRADTAGARAYAAAVSRPGGRSQGRFLTPREWTSRFGASPAEAAKVVAFLRANGFSHVAVNPSRTGVSARASAARAERVFGVTLRRYSVAGQVLQAPDRNVRVPAALGHAVTAVVGLSQTPEIPTLARTDQRGPTGRTAPRPGSAPATAVLAVPCSTYYGEHQVSGLPLVFGVTTLPTELCTGYVPKQIQSAYGLTTTIAKGTTGRGVKVAIIDAYRLPTMASDLTRYSATYGLPALKAGQFTENLPASFANQDECGGVAGWNEEEALDVESVHTAAPGANIVYIAGSDCITGLSDAFDRLLAGNGKAPLASIVSNSYGDGGEGFAPADQAAETLQFVQAAAEGVSVLFSSGDSGDEAGDNDGIAQPSEPAVNPWATAVGGTTIGIGASGKTLFQTGWETSRDALLSAGGALEWALPLPGQSVFGATGGTSAAYTEPGYQKGVVPDALAYARGNGVAGRVVPDISAIGDPYTGFREGYSSIDPATGKYVYAENSIGGTSLSSPMTAGMVALAQQWNSRPLGFLNTALYSLTQTGALSDVRPPNPTAVPSQQGVLFDSPSRLQTEVDGFDKASTLLTTRGYDDVTGLGSPNGIYFLTNLARVLK